MRNEDQGEETKVQLVEIAYPVEDKRRLFYTNTFTKEDSGKYIEEPMLHLDICPEGEAGLDYVRSLYAFKTSEEMRLFRKRLIAFIEDPTQTDPTEGMESVVTQKIRLRSAMI